MRRALTRAFGAALLLLALAVPRVALAADPRPLVRVVLVGGEAPSWFDGFVRHLERELGLRGIDVVVVRTERGAGTRRNTGIAADAELVVDAPSPLRPVLSFAVAPRDEGMTPDGSLVGRVRQVNLAGVPADGCALALAVAADELMRSNWPRAVPSEAARSATGDGKAAPGPADGPAAAPASGPGENPAAPAPQANPEAASPAARAAPAREGEPSSTGAEPTTRATAAGSGFRSALAVAAAAEAFAGGQTQLGPDLRWAVRIVPRLEVQVRGGWRRMLRYATTNGAVDGSVLVAGGALKVLVLGSASANMSFVGRADLLRVVYSGQPRDAATFDGSNENALGFVVAAGPSARIALTRALGIEGELLAGASPRSTTVTDAWNAVVSTNGAALMGSLGLSLGL